VGPNRPPPADAQADTSAADAADKADHFERRAQEVAMTVALAAAAKLGAAMSAEQRDACTAAAAASVLSIVTFGPMVFGILLGFNEPTAVPDGIVATDLVSAAHSAHTGDLVPPLGVAPGPLRFDALRISHTGARATIPDVVAAITALGLGLMSLGIDCDTDAATSAVLGD